VHICLFPNPFGQAFAVDWLISDKDLTKIEMLCFSETLRHSG